MATAGEAANEGTLNDRAPIEEAEAWLRRSTGAGYTDRVVRRLLLHTQKLERRLQKQSARVIDLEQQLASGDTTS